MSQTVERAIGILEHVSERPRSLSEIAEFLGVHKSTAFRLIQTLANGGLLRREADGQYRAGYRLIGLANQASEQFDLRTLAHFHLVTLGEQCGHTVHLAAVVDRRIVYVDKVEPSTGSIRLYSQVGKPVQLNTAGVSKAILASLPESTANELLTDCDFARFTSTTITSRTQFREELHHTAQRGWAVDDGEFEDFINCLAAPIPTQSLHAAISITALRPQADLTVLQQQHLPALLATADAIGRELSGGGWG
ncbi:IclR family transcriptional regulator [Spiractinospora alimapuensis]|uniref:IclR family transcriptional regulator n=1 Tax=Spiractinospora alimapuensis TaxID=2820884 RepID=UPI001F483687|nr:IclR family transcriptional regulator [Spiractinospora alimapuensis]QVQ53794.1 IclR family transcriptional regulator [Spiractinospora alimapuensis]